MIHLSHLRLRSSFSRPPPTVHTRSYLRVRLPAVYPLVVSTFKTSLIREKEYYEHKEYDSHRHVKTTNLFLKKPSYKRPVKLVTMYIRLKQKF